MPALGKFGDTSEIAIPSNPLEQVIGQEHVIEIARIVALQKRHLLLVGPPGTGKSFIANTIATLMPKPMQQVSVVANASNPERPMLEVKMVREVEEELRRKERVRLIDPRDAPYYVAERLGFRCRKCGTISDPESNICLYCGAEKYRKSRSFEDIVSDSPRLNRDDKVLMKKSNPDTGEEDEYRYERAGSRVRVYKNAGKSHAESRKIIVPLSRKVFVQATGASEAELLGDVRHDPYGGHHEIGTPIHERIVPCLLYTSPSPRDRTRSRMPSSA